MKKLLCFILTYLFLSSSYSFAQTTLISPQAITMEGAESPGFGTEALHHIRFTVLADGTTDDIEVVGGFTTQFAKQFLSQTVNGWTFEPGTENGNPVDFYNQDFIIRASLAEGLAISEDIEKTLEEVSTLSDEDEYDKAVRLLERTIKNDVVTVFDYALSHEILSSIYMSMNDPFQALAASKVSTMSRTNSSGEIEYMLPPEMLQSALRKRFLLAASVSQNAEAVRAYDILNINFDIQANDPIIAQAEEAKAIINSPEPMGMLAKITDKAWSYEPARRIFTVADVDGTLRKINVRCERRNLELDFEEGVDWTLPESFGKCILDFEGRDNTQFTVYEFSE